MLHITEDTPADMLAGSMELIIHLPTGKIVKMFVERSTPMMDMLVQITTNNQLQITNYVLQPLQTSSNPDRPEKILTYYPNTPIGTLDTQHIRVVSKTRTLPVPKNIPPGHQPFESTFRLKVHLPRNQLYVTRVSRHVHIEDIMRKVCEEKDLDSNKYEVRHPGNLNEVLDPKLTLNDYMITEIHLVMKNSNPNQTFSSNDIMTLKKDSERKQLQSKSGGVFNLIFKKNKSNNGSGPFSAAINSIFTTRKDNKSVSQPVVPIHTNSNSNSKPKTEIPKPPQRKRRPAPKPPQIVEKIENPPQNEPVEMRIKPVENSDDKNETSLTICHSRHSSDSSGYHETSFLSDQCNTSLPRMRGLKEGKISKNDRRHTDNFENKMATTARSRSTPSLVFPGRKKKAAPSPPVISQKSMNSPTNLEKPNPVVASLTSVGFFPSRTEFSSTERSNGSSPEIYATIDRTTKLNSITHNTESIIETEEEFIINEECTDYGKYPADSGNSSDISEKSKKDERIIDEEIVDVPQINEDDAWQPPSPPKAFKDSDVNQNVHTETAQTNSVIDVELIRKLKAIEGEQNANEMKIHEEPPIYNKLSLENLEKRRSLVYNRELATSLKPKCRSNSFMQETNKLSKKFQSDLDLSGKSNEFDKMLEDIRRNNIENEKNKTSLVQSTLPNFKITTYDEPKQNVKVFEDDTIRSNSNQTNLNKAQSLQRIYIPNSTENIAELCQNNTEYMFKKGRKSRMNEYRRSVNRSESFSSENNGWLSKPVTRSKSQVGIKKFNDSEGSLSKSSSLFDISGLQSLGVMKKIQDKLNTPTASMETLDTTEEEIKNIRQKIEDVKSSKNRYSYPASINIGTWSERPKIPVNIHQDIAKNSENQEEKQNNETVTIKIESSPITTQKNGNVIIKIGKNESSNNESRRATLPSDFDVSRVPVVRAVELKKDVNVGSKSKFYNVENESMPIFRKKSFLQFTSTLMNFKNSKTPAENTIKYDKPMDSNEKEYTTNQNVPFSKMNLRRTESKKMEENGDLKKFNKLDKFPSVQSKSSTLPPRMKESRIVVDPREELLKSIRDFGGKKGLRSRKA